MAQRYPKIVFTEEVMREGMQIESASIPTEDKVRLLVRFVPVVDAPAVEGVWSASMKAKTPDAILCVMLAGPALAPSKDIATAISEQRRKTRNAGPVLVPVDVRDWEALFPPDTPAVVRALIQRLKEDQR